MTSLDAPIWLLDIDGVLNAVTHKCPEGYVSDYSANGYLIQWDPRVIETIKALHESKAIDIFWLTTWGNIANEHMMPLLGMPELVVFADPYDAIRGTGWWKFDAFKRMYQSERRYIWTDDDLRYEPEAQEWAREQGDIMLVTPDMKTGLTREMLEEICKFAGVDLPDVW